MAEEDKENMTPADSSSLLLSSSSLAAAANASNFNTSNSIGSGLKLSLADLHASRIVRFGENEQDIFMLKDDDTARAMLVDKVKADPASPEKWLELLKAPPSFEAKVYSKVRLMRRATSFIPKDKCRTVASYVEIWLRFARLKDEKDARDTYKYMKTESIGDQERMFYEHYAAFEYENGNELEADEILSLGVQKGAFTARDKAVMYQRLVKGERPAFLSSSSSSATTPRQLQTPHSQKNSTARSHMTPGRELTPGASTTVGLMTTPGTRTTKKSAGFSTARKAALLSTPATGTRPPASAQTTSRKGTPSTRMFNLGGPPLRVVAAADFAMTEDRDSLLDSDDDDPMGMMEEPVRIKAEPMSPIRETRALKTETVSIKTEEIAVKQEAWPSQSAGAGASTSSAPTPAPRRQPTPTSAAKAAADLSYIKNWAPRPISSMSSSSRAPSFDHNNPDLYPSPKRRNLGATSSEKGDIGASGPQIRLDPLSPISVGSVSSSTSSPLSSSDGTVPRDPFAKLTSKVVVNGSTYIKLEQIGSGGSSKVYRMLGPDLKIYALKKIKLKRLDPKSVEQYTNEIQLLKRLQGNPFIIRLISAEQDMSERVIHVLMEHGEIDLGERLRELKDGVDENFLRVLWTQMLQAVHAIHTERIIHGDLKPANFLFVNGALKLIDFGIAKAISNDTTNIERDSQVGTVNFMSPEAIQGNAGPGGQRNPQGKMKVGRASDIWSLGCILYQIVYGKPPFGDLGSIIEKFRCIIDPKYEIPFPPLLNKELEDVIRKCLQRDHRARPTIDGPNGLLQHSFLKNTATSSSAALTVTLANGEAVLGQMADLLRTQGVEKSKVATFVSIGQDGLRAGNSASRSSSSTVSNHYQPTRGAYKYDTEERRTDI